MRELMPGFEELHVAKVSDGSFILRSDKQIVVTAASLPAALKVVKEFFTPVEPIVEPPK